MYLRPNIQREPVIPGRGIIDWLAAFMRDEGGQSVVEYSLLLSLISASSVFMVTLMGLSIGRLVGVDSLTIVHYTEWAIDKYQER
jgi:Flp pilus assembly pilin Flp